MTTKIKEHTCEACMGTGYPVVLQPVQPGRKIYPVKCYACEGKGKIVDACAPLGNFGMKNDPYPLHITSALASLSIVLVVWMLLGNG